MIPRGLYPYLSFYMKNCLCLKFLIALFATLMSVWILQGCSGSKTDYDAVISDAQLALDEGDASRSGRICAELLNKDIDALDEQQLGRLAIIFMKLSEVENSDENVADATQCFRRAWKLSADSMRSFVSQLPPEDLPRYVILSRIGGSIDSPPDLSEETFPEDSIHFLHESD